MTNYNIETIQNNSKQLHKGIHKIIKNIDI